MEFSGMKRILPLFVTALAAAVAGVAFAVFRSVPPSTPEERKQMDILTGQLFVFNGVTNEINRARTINAFDEQHEVLVYLRLISDCFEQYQWPKDRPVRVVDRGERIVVTWPLPPEIESQPIRWGPDYLHQAVIDKKDRKIIRLSQGS